MLGTVVNAMAILLGGVIGLLFRGGIPEKYTHTVMHALGLSVILIGVKGALQSIDLLVVIVSLCMGSFIGEFFNIEKRLQDLGSWVGQKVSKDTDSIATGFVTTTLVFCVGAMAIVGSLESGLTGNHQTLFAKSILDGVASIIFASTMGIGVIFSAISVMIYQGTITLAASFLKPYLVPEVVAQMSSIGGILIIAIGLGLLDIKKMKIGNMLPGIFLPLLYFVIKSALL